MEGDVLELLRQETGMIDLMCCFDGLEHFEDLQQQELLELMAKKTKYRLLFNLPNRDFTEWCRKRAPEKLQHIDRPPAVADLVHRMDQLKFHLRYCETYGIEVPCQYRFLAFDRRVHYEKSGEPGTEPDPGALRGG